MRRVTRVKMDERGGKEDHSEHCDREDSVSGCRTGEKWQTGLGWEWHAGRLVQRARDRKQWLQNKLDKSNHIIWHQPPCWGIAVQLVHLPCSSLNGICTMDSLTSFDGGVSWGHVGLLIFHNSPVKAPGGPARSHTNLSHSLSHTHKPQTPCYFTCFLNSTCRHLTQEEAWDTSQAHRLPVGRF